MDRQKWSRNKSREEDVVIHWTQQSSNYNQVKIQSDAKIKKCEESMPVLYDKQWYENVADEVTSCLNDAGQVLEGAAYGLVDVGKKIILTPYYIANDLCEFINNDPIGKINGFPAYVLNGGIDNQISNQFQQFTSDYQKANTEKQSEMVMGVLGNIALLAIPGMEFTKFGKAGEAVELAGDLNKGGKAVEAAGEADKAVEAGGKLTGAEQKAEAAEKAKILEEESKVLTESRNLQKSIIESVENGKAKLETTLQKGNYGEIKMDDYYETHGYERISNGRVTELNQVGHQGIDGVYCNPGPPPKYIIGEAKYATSQLSTLADGTKQMSDEWIAGGEVSRLKASVGKDIADDILLEGYDRELTKIDSNGNVVTRLLDADGNIIK